jgi:hypothetical protein
LLFMMFFNPKHGVTEKELVDKFKAWNNYSKGKLEGFGSGKLYRHHNGANPRYYQLHVEMKNYGSWDEFLAFLEEDTKGAGLMQEWRKLIDLNTHFDEFVIEIPL